jgi:hypothetical protein
MVEAYEMLDEGFIDEADFRDFTFGNVMEMHAGMNPEFSKTQWLRTKSRSSRLRKGQLRRLEKTDEPHVEPINSVGLDEVKLERVTFSAYVRRGGQASGHQGRGLGWTLLSGVGLSLSENGTKGIGGGESYPTCGQNLR